MANSSCDHTGHRDRMRKKFITNGFDGFEEHEVLEIMLYYAIARKDTNPIAHNLLDTFGSISAVLDAPIDRLTDAGLSQNAAVYLKTLPEISRIYLDDKHNNNSKVVSSENIGDTILRKFIGRDYEAVVLLLLDAKYKEVFCGVISKGSVNACEIYIRKIIELAVMYNARFAVMAHNHPSGIALPSTKDLDTTKKVVSALKLIEVSMIDHIIVADNDYVSLSESGLKEELFM
ncbi:MAG TPA: DNA repair protein RadC [Clostridiales bacterium]|nr:DNA repair protein RadC [Clostridiales bacterium]